VQLAPLSFSLDVAPLRAQLAEHHELWNAYRWRTEHPRSPHRECADIWCRYNALENLGPRFNDEHESVWYPVIDTLTAVPALCTSVIDKMPGRALAGVLVTKVPAGKRVYPHADFGWHAENTEKVAVLIDANRDQTFCFEGIEHRSVTGECFAFNNQTPHWVENPSDEDRVTLIVCLRRVH
jgi:hypothetical protein